MTFKKLFSGYLEKIKIVISGLFYRSIFADIILGQNSQLLGVWAVAAIKMTQQQPATLSYIFALREFFMAFIVMWIIQIHKIIDTKIVWRLMLLTSIVAATLTAFFPLGSLSFVILLTVAFCGFKACQALIGIDALSAMRKDQEFALRVSLVIFFSPLLFTIISILFGWIAEVNLSLVFLISGLFGLGCFIITFRHPPNIKKLNQEYDKKLSLPKSSELLIKLCMSHNFLNNVINFIILPIYLYQESNGDLSKFGFYLGLSGLAAMIGNQLNKSVKKKDVNAFVGLIVCALTIPIISIAWGIFYHIPIIAVMLIVLKQAFIPVWNASFTINFKEMTGDELYRRAIHRITYNTRLAMGVSHIIGALFFINHLEYYPLILIGFGVVNIFSNGTLLLLIKNATKQSAQ